MVPARLTFTFALIVAGALTMTACGKSSPTTPSATAPRIDSISPGTLQPSPSPQDITFVGANFQANLSLSVTAPDNSLTVVSGSAIQQVQSQSFQATITLSQTGTYTFVVQNISGDRSGPFTVVVQHGGSTLPAIGSITPNSLARTTQPTLVLIQGTNFAANASVTVVDPTGLSANFPIQPSGAASSTSIELSITFNVPGVYAFFVVNPGGDASNTVLVTVT